VGVAREWCVRQRAVKPLPWYETVDDFLVAHEDEDVPPAGVSACVKRFRSSYGALARARA
jgi:hypothetical protein